MDIEEYKHRGGEKADKVKNKRYMGKHKKTMFVGCMAKFEEPLMIKNVRNPRNMLKTMLKDENEWDEFQAPITKRVKGIERRD